MGDESMQKWISECTDKNYAEYAREGARLDYDQVVARYWHDDYEIHCGDCKLVLEDVVYFVCDVSKWKVFVFKESFYLCKSCIHKHVEDINVAKNAVASLIVDTLSYDASDAASARTLAKRLESVRVASIAGDLYDFGSVASKFGFRVKYGSGEEAVDAEWGARVFTKFLGEMEKNRGEGGREQGGEASPGKRKRVE